VRTIVGLLGGSFNPAHEGHLHISLVAKRELHLREIWWLVSPQNPLKPSKGMAPFSERFSSAEKVTNHVPFIHISDIEQRMHTRYTIDTLRKLKRRYPRTQFVWLMGGDSLASIHRWENWEAIFNSVPVLVLDRNRFSHTSLRTKAALRFARSRVPVWRLLDKAKQGLPAWAYIHMARHPASSTEIRKNLEKGRK
jgi:nicotinate-nucleotide adenylyltransferase